MIDIRLPAKPEVIPKICSYADSGLRRLPRTAAKADACLRRAELTVRHGGSRVLLLAWPQSRGQLARTSVQKISSGWMRQESSESLMRAPRAGALPEGFAPLWEGRGDTCPVCHRLYGLGQLRASVDHIVPLSQGGKHSVTNIRIICKGCNEDAWHSIKHLPSIQFERAASTK